MKLEWIEDLLAISEAGSLTEAAARRHISQPAFSRRIRGIEEQLGITLIDRSRRPARPIRAVTDNVEVYRELVSRLRQLPSYLLGTERIVIACQHSLSISAVPGIAEKILRVTPKATIRVRAANRDQCLALLMTQQADFMVAFETDELPAIGHNDFVERKVLARGVASAGDSAGQAGRRHRFRTACRIASHCIPGRRVPRYVDDAQCRPRAFIASVVQACRRNCVHFRGTRACARRSGGCVDSGVDCAGRYLERAAGSPALRLGAVHDVARRAASQGREVRHGGGRMGRDPAIQAQHNAAAVPRTLVQEKLSSPEAAGQTTF